MCWALLPALALLAVPPQAQAQNPCDLFWEADASSALAGGGDVPGQITGRPEVERPTSLACAARPTIRLDLHSQTPIVIKQGRETIARWQTEVAAEESVAPLRRRADGPGWTVGFRHETGESTIETHKPTLDYRVSLADEQQTVAVAYADRAGWVYGGGASWGDFRAGASGDTVAEVLRLPTDTTRWPRLRADSRQFTLGLSRHEPSLQWGVQYSVRDPRVALRLTRGGSSYSAALPADGQRWEAYGALRQGNEMYFATAADDQGQAHGTLLLGLAARGDLRASSHDSTVALGWRRARKRRATQVMADWRRSTLHTRDQGYAGLFPGMLGDVYGLQGDVQTSTLSVRYGAELPVARGWSVLAGVSAHRTTVDGDWRLRRTRGLGQNPETVSEQHLRDGVLTLAALALGARYADTHWTATVAGTVAYGSINQALKDLFHEEPEPGEKPNQFRPEPLLALSVEYRF